MKPQNKDIKQSLRYKNMVARVEGLSPDEKGAQLLKALAVGTQWRIDAVLDALDKKLYDWNYIDRLNVFKQAAMFGQLHAIERMAKNKYFKADPAPQRGKYQAPPDIILEAFDTAVIHGNYAVADYCKSLGAGKDYMIGNRAPRAMLLAVAEGNITKMGYLIDAGTCREYYLDMAVVEGNKKSVDYLLSRGADINFVNGQLTPLGRAIQCGHEDLFHHLLDKGADPKISARENMYYAINGNKVGIVKTLLEHGVVPNKDDLTNAEYHKRDEIVALLKKHMPKGPDSSAPKP
ncbi:MAG: ankyrin repeat domain-containing protein [Alphaproteobacteria bacterium]|nr:ankyrin repeat domain-containing protein [Alphaproteobacteria bacterium]MDE2337306.1 ankyrin repeat domain-containing protein [Alphaproteobacteria bacterium]